MTNNYIKIYDPSNKFYAGMHKNEAIQNGTFNTLMFRDFKNIDKDQDGILSVNEIMNERNKMSKRYNTSKYIWLVLTIANIFAKYKMIPKLINSIILGFVTSSVFIAHKKLKQDTNEYINLLKNKEKVG